MFKYIIGISLCVLTLLIFIFLIYLGFAVILQYIKKVDNSTKFCPLCREKDFLNELIFLDKNESFFCDECGKLFNKKEIE